MKAGPLQYLRYVDEAFPHVAQTRGRGPGDSMSTDAMRRTAMAKAHTRLSLFLRCERIDRVSVYLPLLSDAGRHAILKEPPPFPPGFSRK